MPLVVAGGELLAPVTEGDGADGPVVPVGGEVGDWLTEVSRPHLDLTVIADRDQLVTRRGKGQLVDGQAVAV